MRQGARRLESRSCSVVAELDQSDMVVSMKERGESLFGAKVLFSKGDVRESVDTMALFG